MLKNANSALNITCCHWILLQRHIFYESIVYIFYLNYIDLRCDTYRHLVSCFTCFQSYCAKSLSTVYWNKAGVHYDNVVICQILQYRFSIAGYVIANMAAPILSILGLSIAMGRTCRVSVYKWHKRIIWCPVII